jgi:glutamate/aspartate transport system permease protein
MLLMGLAWTVVTGVCAWIVALVLGTVVGVLRTLPSRGAERAGFAYVELFRNTPLVVQLFLWFFVMPELLPSAWGTWLKQLQNGPFYTAVIGLGLYMSARVAEQLRAGIGSMARGQRRAALACGLTLPQAYRYVLLPMAFRIVLPPLTSEFLNTLKNTSVALTIGLLELTSRARAMQEFSFQVFEAFAVATVLYLLLNLVVVVGMRWLERRVAVPGFIAGAH